MAGALYAWVRIGSSWRNGVAWNWVVSVWTEGLVDDIDGSIGTVGVRVGVMRAMSGSRRQRSASMAADSARSSAISSSGSKQ